MTVITAKLLSESFSYDPYTGILSWKFRPRDHFSSDKGQKTFNTRFAGKEAGSINREGYRVVGIFGRLLLVHRVIWVIVTGDWPEGEIDHEDHVRDNNRINNLRDATSLLNSKNMSRYSNNTSGVTGVSWHSRNLCWLARIGVSGKQILLGRFEEKEDAVRARREAEHQYRYHGNHGNVKSDT